MRLKTTATSDFEQSYDERYETQIVKRLVDLADIRSDTSRNNIKKDIPLALKQWDERYDDDNLLITTITSRTAVSMKMGDSATLTTVVNITKPDAQNLDIAYSWDKLEVRSAEAVSTLTTEHLFGNIMKKSRSMKMRDLFMKETADLDSDILIFKPIGRDSFVCALKDNSLVLVKDSECIWKRDFENEIYSVEYTSYNGGMILAGWGDNVLTALDMKSDTIWENRVKAKKTEFPGWEMLTPRIVCIKYGFTDNLHFVAAGCGDNFIRLFDMTGTMLQECYDYATVPDIIELFDVDGDGKPELMGAGKTASNRGAFYIHDINGRALNPIIVGPWLCIFRSHIIRETDGRLCIACGMNYGANFRRLSVEKGKYNEEFSKCIGGTVSAIHMDDDTGNFYVGSSKGAILSFDKNGNDLWYSDAQSPVQDIIPYANSIIAISNNGEIRQVSTEGKIERLSTFSQSVNSCIDGDGNVFISSGHKLFKLI